MQLPLKLCALQISFVATLPIKILLFVVASFHNFKCQNRNSFKFSILKKEFLYTLGQLVLQPRQLCGLLIRNCGTPFNPFDSNWLNAKFSWQSFIESFSRTVPLPPKPKNPASWHPRFHHRHPSRNNLPVRILQLSDIHYDPAYLEGAEADCAEPMCCIKRVPKTKRRAGFWGTVGKCDVPLRTVENLFEHINRTHKVVQYNN